MRTHKIFPGTRIDRGKNTEAEFETTAKGYRLGTSVGGTLTGRGGNLIIIDDPMKPADAMSDTKRAAVTEWYDSTLSSRLDQKTQDAVVLIMQRLHMDDLVGHVLEKGGREWTHLNLPAIADVPQEIDLGNGMTYKREIGEILHPEREPLWVLDDLKVDLGSSVFSAQYQQEPVPRDGTLVKREWFRYYRQVPERDSNDWIVQSWDTASKTGKSNDYSVCTTWLVRDNVYYLIDVLRERLEYPDLKRRMIAHAAAYDAEVVLIEDASSGAGLIQDLFDDGRIHPIAMRPEGDKVVRLEKRTAVIEAGQVRLPESAPWLGEFVDEVLAFPSGRFDDQVDSLSQFLTWVRERQDTFDIAGF